MAFGVIASVAGVTAPAQAASTNVGSVNGVVARCDSSPYLLCQFYRSNFTGAMWGTSGRVDNLSSARFVGPGDGAGAVVRNAAASMSCDTSVSGNLWCWSYVSPNRTGNIDYLFPQKSGTLVYTRNNGASVDIF
jgi:hypothetical protein